VVFYCRHGNGCDVAISLKVLPDKSGVKIFIVCPRRQKYVFVIFSRFKRIITITKPFRATLRHKVVHKGRTTRASQHELRVTRCSRSALLVIHTCTARFMRKTVRSWFWHEQQRYYRNIQVAIRDFNFFVTFNLLKVPLGPEFWYSIFLHFWT